MTDLLQWEAQNSLTSINNWLTHFVYHHTIVSVISKQCRQPVNCVVDLSASIATLMANIELHFCVDQTETCVRWTWIAHVGITEKTGHWWTFTNVQKRKNKESSHKIKFVILAHYILSISFHSDELKTITWK